MAKTLQISTKRVAISKANAQMVIIVAVAAAVTVFCLVASRAVLTQNIYRSKVVKEKTVAHKQLQTNIKTFNELRDTYQSFDDNPQNIIGRSSAEAGDNTGSNSKIILNSLPSTYDFPALTSSLEKVLKDGSLKVHGIEGTDDQIAQQANVSSATPVAVPIPFSFSIEEADYTSVQKLIAKLQSSVRPIVVDSIKLDGPANKMQLNMSAHTFYQPGKTVNITKKVVK